MKPVIFSEAEKLWKNLTRDVNNEDFDFDLSIHKKLLNIFQVGDFYYFIFNLRASSFEVVSEEITKVLGYPAQNVTVPFFLSKIHPEDQPWFLNFENKVVEFFAKLTPQQIPNYKISYDYRIRKDNGEYIRILQQTITIHFDENSQVLRTFVVHTDISHLKKHGKPVFSLIGLNGEPSYYNIDVKNVFSSSSQYNLTRRERQVLGLIILGKSSKQISEELFISKQTVDSHRKNLLKKTNAVNTASLISFAIENGLI